MSYSPPLLYVTVTSSPYTAGLSEYIFVDDDAVGGAVTVNLPAISQPITYRIKKLGSTGNVTVAANGSEKIDEAASVLMLTQYESLTITNDGTDWWIV